MLKLVILGTGNLSKQLCRALAPAKGVQIVQLVGRSAREFGKFPGAIPKSTDFHDIAEADLYLLAVNDDAIPELSGHLAQRRGLVAHTSGTVPLQALRASDRGVFYPLQTFSAARAVDFTDIPLCLEAERPESLRLLETLGRALSGQIHEIGSGQRKILHLAAVFVNNFTNALYGVGQEICRQEGLSFDLLKPLILETAQKVQAILPGEAQTGPARRGDLRTQGEHLELLRDQDHKALYALLSETIKKQAMHPRDRPWDQREQTHKPKIDHEEEL